MKTRAALLPLLALAFLAGCVTPPSASGGAAPVLAWIQLGAGDSITLRAIVAAGAVCPTATVDGKARVMVLRAAPSVGATIPAFGVSACELVLPANTAEVRVDGRAVVLPAKVAQRIVVVGDTGCRIKVAAKGNADPVQDCSDPVAWPWPRLAATAALTLPDLVIHVGDYHYREYCDDPERCRPLTERGVSIGYGWDGWQADFFSPAAPLLSAAPWVFVRGNHENCDRAGEGWMRFLSPLPYAACEREAGSGRSTLTDNHTADAYRVELGGALALIVADNAGHEDWRPATVTPQDVRLFEQTLTILNHASTSQPLWFFSHKPIWYDLIAPANQPNAMQTTLRQGLSDKLQIAFGGHQHNFEAINFAPDADRDFHPGGRPAQVIVGGGGTQLEALDPRSSFFEQTPGSREQAQPDGRLYDGIRAESGIVLNRYSFLLLEHEALGWRGTVLDPDGRVITHCTLRHGEKRFDCPFPER